MLFCKPSPKTKILIESGFGPGQILQFRSLDLKRDLNLLHQWVNLPYAKKFWQLEGTAEHLKTVYQHILKNPNAHSFIGSLDEQLVCQIDCYRVETDELGKHIRCHPNDCGIHLLMAPLVEPIRGLSRKLMEVFLRYYFSFPDAQSVYAEPDIYNHKACTLLSKCGFGFVQNIMLSSKAASVYHLTKKQFYATYHHPNLNPSSPGKDPIP